MIQKLIHEIDRKKAPIVVGLDPQLSFLPENILKESTEKYGETLEAAGDAVFRFNKAIVDAVADLVPAVKPQIAMYEQFGIPGLKAFRDTVEYCRKKGLLVIGDVKRGDIGSTSGAYATAHLGSVKIGTRTFRPFNEDFATVNPYLGSDGIKPFVDVCRKEDRGIFVLVKTSNPSSGELQDKITEGRPVYEMMAEYVESWGKETMEGDYSNVGAVAGATYPEIGAKLRRLMPHAYILVPGYGAQGGTGKDLAGFFNPDGFGAVINSSRGIIAAYKQEKYAAFGEDHFAEASRAAVLDMKKDIQDALDRRKS